MAALGAGYREHGAVARRDARALLGRLQEWRGNPKLARYGSAVAAIEAFCAKLAAKALRDLGSAGRNARRPLPSAVRAYGGHGRRGGGVPAEAEIRPGWSGCAATIRMPPWSLSCWGARRSIWPPCCAGTAIRTNCCSPRKPGAADAPLPGYASGGPDEFACRACGDGRRGAASG